MKGERNSPPPSELPETTGPMESTPTDICGPYPNTWKKNKYLLAFIDKFIQYPKSIPIPNKEAGTVARALVTHVFAQHRCPQVLSSDWETNFVNPLPRDVYGTSGKTN
jgi:hypothetical protein